jgi:hypothetical protein
MNSTAFSGRHALWPHASVAIWADNAAIPAAIQTDLDAMLSNPMSPPRLMMPSFNLEEAN